MGTKKETDALDTVEIDAAVEETKATKKTTQRKSRSTKKETAKDDAKLPIEEAGEEAAAAIDAEAVEVESEPEPITPAVVIRKSRSKKAAKSDAEDDDDANAAVGKKAKDSAVKLRREKQMEARKREEEMKRTQQFLLDWSIIQTAMKRGKIVTGTIVSVHTTDLQHKGIANDKIPAVMVDVILDEAKSIKAVIPFDELFTRDAIKYPVDADDRASVNEYTHARRALAEKLYGLSTPLVITDMTSDAKLGAGIDYSITVSRKQALKRIEAYNYDPIGDNEPAILEGDIVNATIVSIAPNSIRVCVGGVDTTIDIPFLTFRYVGSASLWQFYHVGDEIPVVVTKIEKRKDGSHKVLANAKQAELAEAKIRAATMLNPGTMCLGQITSCRPNHARPDQATLCLYLQDYGMPATAKNVSLKNFGRPVQVGDVVRVTVTGIGDSGMVFAAVRGIHGSAGF